eukprot:TRINITY_DN13550_c0_g1_i5.p1 TRINITY_DN13550_c0_g1~~TRINITY_DN13550_c0_g1_i5.p1  ORF type:complete len:287 (-),score=75.52 TRINITY_DN13550_c0_g1_i5:118-978(-)
MGGCMSAEQDQTQDFANLPAKERLRILRAQGSGSQADTADLLFQLSENDPINGGEREWLLSVCRHKLWDQLDSAIRTTKDVNAKDGRADFSPLHWVAYHGNLECAKMLLLAGANPSLTSTTTGPEGPLDPAGVARMRGFPKMAHLLARFGHETRNSEFQSSRTKTLGPKASRKCNSGLKAGQRGHHQRGCTFLHYHHVGHESGAAKLDLLGQVLREAGQCKSICIYVNHTSTIHKLLPYLESTFGEHSPQSGIGKWAIISSEAGFRASNTMQRWVSRDMDLSLIHI